MRYRTTDNEHCPRFVAYSGPDEYVEADDDLERLLAILREMAVPDEPEDIAVWQDGCKLAAVVLGDGHVVRFDDRSRLNRSGWISGGTPSPYDPDQRL